MSMNPVIVVVAIAIVAIVIIGVVIAKKRNK